MATWRCVKNCGACCHLNPADRPDLDQYLLPEELEIYLSMVGEEGWCINFDHINRECLIYEQRPRFCRVEPNIFKQMYGVEAAEFNDFAIDCCRQQIKGVYGKNSEEMEHYDEEVKQ